MNTIPTSFEQLEKAMLALGYDEVIERTWNPGQIVDTHTHPFAANAVVVKGEMWLDVDSDDHPKGPQLLVPGDRFALDANVPHRERYGTEGATYWVARKK